MRNDALLARENANKLPCLRHQPATCVAYADDRVLLPLRFKITLWQNRPEKRHVALAPEGSLSDELNCCQTGGWLDFATGAFLAIVCMMCLSPALMHIITLSSFHYNLR